MREILLFVLVGTVAACGAARAPEGRVHTESSEASALANYRTFGFRPAGQPAAPFEVSARSFEVERRIRPLIVAGLVQKGYMEQAGDQAKPDFVIVFGSGYAQGPAPSVDQQGGAGLAATPSIEKGRIAIDAFDSSSDTQVWHGTAEAVVDPQKIDDRLLQTAVQQVLASFPARSAVAATQVRGGE
jgi:hypothetical protein